MMFNPLFYELVNGWVLKCAVILNTMQLDLLPTSPIPAVSVQSLG